MHNFFKGIWTFNNVQTGFIFSCHLCRLRLGFHDYKKSDTEDESEILPDNSDDTRIFHYITIIWCIIPYIFTKKLWTE